jgi:vancomycin resistance protein VanJ
VSNKNPSQRQAPPPNPALSLASTLALLLTCAYAAMILGWLAARQLWGDRLWLLAVANSFPAVFFLPLPVAFVLAAFSRKRAAWVAVCVSALLWVALFGWRYLPRGLHAEATGTELRVMAFNVLVTNRDVGAIAGAVETAQPDLIAFSELGAGMNAALAERLGTTYPFRTLRRLPGANFGSGIYSRWPLDDLGSLKTGLGLRSAVADVNTPKGTVRFVALHPRSTWLDTSSLDAAEASIEDNFRGREAQLAAVCRYLDEWGDRPVILAGDFNTSEFSDAYRCVAHRLRDSYREVGQGMGHTWPAQRTKHIQSRWMELLAPVTRIDFVFHSHHWDALEAKVLTMDTGSDHRPVVATLRRTNDE